jgi:hypothetical protein
MWLIHRQIFPTEEANLQPRREQLAVVLWPSVHGLRTSSNSCGPHPFATRKSHETSEHFNVVVHSLGIETSSGAAQ